MATRVDGPPPDPPETAPGPPQTRVSLAWPLAGAAAVVALVSIAVLQGQDTAGKPLAALLTGLTAGGLSCLAVQAGLLASALKPDQETGRVPAAAPTIGAFLAAKLVAYTLLGALLGYFGSLVQLSVTTRGVMQLVIGAFMLGTALRMIYPHPWLRWFVLEPPSAVRRMIRRVSKSPDGYSTPVFLGALTALIPCGVTQAMMAMALATGSISAGAITMFMFTLGTIPLFFGLSYAATSLGKHRQRQFNFAVALLLVVLGALAIKGGLNMTGRTLTAAGADNSPATATATVLPDAQRIQITATKDAYTPARIRAASGTPTELVVTTRANNGCTRTLAIPALKLEQALPSTGTTTIRIPPHPPGKLRFTCGMGMYGGSITFTAGKQDSRTNSGTGGGSGGARPARQRVSISATDAGYAPAHTRAASGTRTELVISTKANNSCTRTFAIPALDLERALPETGTITIQLPPQQPRRLRFTCGMGMYSGSIDFSPPAAAPTRRAAATAESSAGRHAATGIGATARTGAGACSHPAHRGQQGAPGHG